MQQNIKFKRKRKKEKKQRKKNKRKKKKKEKKPVLDVPLHFGVSFDRLI